MSSRGPGCSKIKNKPSSSSIELVAVFESKALYSTNFTINRQQTPEKFIAKALFSFAQQITNWGNNIGLPTKIAEIWRNKMKVRAM